MSEPKKPELRTTFGIASLRTPRNLAALKAYEEIYNRDPHCSLLAKVAAAIKAVDDFDRDKKLNLDKPGHE